MVTLRLAESEPDYVCVLELLEEYSDWVRRQFVLNGMVDPGDPRLATFNREPIPGSYPFIFIARSTIEAVGCAFLRPVDSTHCELKRLYVRQQYRGLAAGFRLMEAVIHCARNEGYRFLRISSHSQFMSRAIKMYRDYGFYTIENYLDDPLQAGDTQMEYDLAEHKVQEKHEIRFKTYIHERVDRVWPMLTTAEGFNRWFTTAMKLEPQPGGSMEFFWKDFGADKMTIRETGTVLWMHPLKEFVFRWGNGAYTTTVQLLFNALNGGTEIEVVESGLPEGDAGMKIILDNGPGWGQALTMLKYYAEYGAVFTHPPKT